MSNYLGLLLKVHIHPLFWAVAGISVLTGHFWELLTLFLIVGFHELGHAASARYFGWKIKQILILPFGGMCEVDEHGNRPIREELIIVASGPLQHVWMGAAILLLEAGSLVSPDFAALFHQYNIMVLLFNLLPIWPLDGGRLVHLFLSVQKPYLKAYKVSLASSFCILAAFHLAVVSIAPLHLNVWIVMLYLYASLWKEWKQIRYSFVRFLLERHYGKQDDFQELKPIEASGDKFIHETMEKFKRGCKHLIHVTGPSGPMGHLDENELLHAYFTEKQVHACLKDIVYHD